MLEENSPPVLKEQIEQKLVPKPKSLNIKKNILKLKDEDELQNNEESKETKIIEEKK